MAIVDKQEAPELTFKMTKAETRPALGGNAQRSCSLFQKSQHQRISVSRILARIAFVALSIVALSCHGTRAQDAEFPNKPIRIVVPSSPGGGGDLTVRKMSESLQSTLGVPIVVENRGGASGTLGSTEVVRAKPDGYTLLVTTGDSLVSGPLMMSKAPYAPLTDFTFLSKLSAGWPILAVHPSQNITSMKGLLEAAKANKDTITYGSFGAGSYLQIFMLALEAQTGVKFKEIPYRGLPEAFQSFLRGEVQMGLAPPLQIANLSREGKVVPIAAVGPGRSPLLPDVPTLSELGYDSSLPNQGIWVGMVGPKGLTNEVSRKLNAAVQTALQKADVRSFIENTGARTAGSSQEEFARDFRIEFEATKQLLERAGVKPQ